MTPDMQQEKDTHEDPWLIAYDEVSKARDRMFNNIKTIQEKFNWMLVGDVVLFATIVQLGRAGMTIWLLLAAVSVLGSVLYALFGIQVRGYLSGPVLEQIADVIREGASRTAVLEGVSRKIDKDLRATEAFLVEDRQNLKMAGYLFILGLFLLLFTFIPSLISV